MEPRLLLQWLLDRDGENANSLAVKLKQRTTQPQIHKYLKGTARQPRHDTLAPVANYYRIPIEALYSEEAADREMARIKSGVNPPDYKQNQTVAHINSAQAAINSEVTIEQAVQALAQRISACTSKGTDALAGTLVSLSKDPGNPIYTDMLLKMLQAPKRPSVESKDFQPGVPSIFTKTTS